MIRARSTDRFQQIVDRVAYEAQVEGQKGRVRPVCWWKKRAKEACKKRRTSGEFWQRTERDVGRSTIRRGSHIAEAVEETYDDVVVNGGDKHNCFPAISLLRKAY